MCSLAFFKKKLLFNKFYVLCVALHCFFIYNYCSINFICVSVFIINFICFSITNLF